MLLFYFFCRLSGAAAADLSWTPVHVDRWPELAGKGAIGLGGRRGGTRNCDDDSSGRRCFAPARIGVSTVCRLLTTLSGRRLRYIY